MTTQVFDTFDDEDFDRTLQAGDTALVLDDTSVYVKVADGDYDELHYSDHADCVRIGSLTDDGADDDDDDGGYRGDLSRIGGVYYAYLDEGHHCLGRFDDDDDAVTALSNDSASGLTLSD